MLAELLLPLSLVMPQQPPKPGDMQYVPERTWSFDYTHLDLGIAGLNNNENYGNGAALIGEASIGIGEHFYLFGLANRSDFEPSANEIVKTYAGGLGFHTPMNEMSDFQVQAGFTSIDAKGDAGDVTDDGFTVGFGARFHAMEKTEITALVSYADLESASIFWRAGVVYEFNKYIAGTIQGQDSEGGSTALVGMRLSP